MGGCVRETPHQTALRPSGTMALFTFQTIAGSEHMTSLSSESCSGRGELLSWSLPTTAALVPLNKPQEVKALSKRWPWINDFESIQLLAPGTVLGLWLHKSKPATLQCVKLTAKRKFYARSARTATTMLLALHQ